MQHPKPELIALGIQQPWAELILRGIKSIEVRNVPVGMRQTIYLYSSRKISTMKAAQDVVEKHAISVETLPRGQVVGTIEIVGCAPCRESDSLAACVPWSEIEGRYSWQLANPHRCNPPLVPNSVPYGMWFYPFK